MPKDQYTDQQISDFLERAQEIGIGRTMRELGYPKSWATADRWAKTRNIKVAVDELKAKSKEFHDWYTTEEVLLVAQEGMNRVYEELSTNTELTPDDQKKLAESLMKHYNVWANAQGKATSINETRNTDNVDAAVIEMLNEEMAKNARMKEANSDDTVA